MRNWIIYGFRVACVSNSSHDHTHARTHTNTKKIRKLFFCVSCKLGKKESIFLNSYPFKNDDICNSFNKRMSLLLINFSFNHVTETLVTFTTMTASNMSDIIFDISAQLFHSSIGSEERMLINKHCLESGEFG